MASGIALAFVLGVGIRLFDKAKGTSYIPVTTPTTPVAPQIATSTNSPTPPLVPATPVAPATTTVAPSQSAGPDMNAPMAAKPAPLTKERSMGWLSQDAFRFGD